MSSEFITLTCPSCSSRLQITHDTDRFACAHCGNEHVVRRQGGIVSLAPVMEGLARVEAGTNRTAAEMAIPRLRGEIAELDEEIDELRRGITPVPIEPTTTERVVGWALVVSVALFFCSLATQLGWPIMMTLALMLGLVVADRVLSTRRGNQERAQREAALAERTQVREAKQKQLVAAQQVVDG